MEIRYRVAECERIRYSIAFRRYVSARLPIEAARELASAMQERAANVVFLVEGAAA